MKQRYRVTGARPVLDTPPGGEFDHEYTAEEEADHLAAGRLVIVPRRYQVVGASRVHGTDPGGHFTAAFTAGQEAALTAGGHVERADDEKRPTGKPAATTTESKE